MHEHKTCWYSWLLNFYVRTARVCAAGGWRVERRDERRHDLRLRQRLPLLVADHRLEEAADRAERGRVVRVGALFPAARVVLA